MKAESDPKKFKVLFFDIGLTLRLLKLDHRPLLLDPDITVINNGELAELLVGLELIAYRDFKEKAELYYWHREAKSSNAEVDYITNIGDKIVPVEVKSSGTGRMKSLNLFMEIKKSTFGVKVSDQNFSNRERVRLVPFYGIESLLKRTTFHI